MGAEDQQTLPGADSLAGSSGEASRLEQLRRAAELMRQGQFHVEVPTDGYDELARLGESLQSLAHSLEGRFDELARLARITERVSAGLVLEDVLGEIYESFRSIIPYDRIGLALLEDGDEIVRARWARSEAVEVQLGRGYAARVEAGSLGEILESGKPRILNDLETYLEEHPSSESTRLVVEEGIRSSLTCPLVAMGKPVGFLFFSSCEKDTYREIHQGYFMQLASQVAVVIEKSRLYEEMLELNNQLRQAQVALEHEASHDALTELWNRRAVLRLLEQELARAGREGHTLAAIILDLDRFKRVNDEHGHLAGDEVLEELGRRLTARLRSGEFFGRWGGEEFLAVICPGDRAAAERVMERLRRAVGDRPFPTSAGELRITVSLGGAIAEDVCDAEISEILSAADRALYTAKTAGRNRWALEILGDKGD